MNSKMKGGEVRTDPATRAISVTFTQPDGGMSARCMLGPLRLDPLPYLSDPALFVDIVFRPVAGQSAPDGFYVVLQTLSMYVKPETQKTVRSQTVPASAAESLDDGWKRIRLPFHKMTVLNAKDSPTAEWTKRIRSEDGTPDITSEDLLERFQIFGTSKGAFELGKVSLVRMRNVSVEIRNAESDNTIKLEIQGKTAAPDAVVDLKIIDASGKAETRQVHAVNGAYTYVWENPSVAPGKSSTLQALVYGGGSIQDQSIPREVFGFLKDTSHVWLSVKGRDIVTSPLSKGGVRPFYPVGAGYGKNVLLRGYDEEVAAYAQSMGLNTLRLAFYTLNFNGAPDKPLTFEDITAFIDPVLTAAKRHQLYVILDDHNYFKNEINEETARGEQKSDGWTEEKFQRWVQRWVEVAEHYKDEPYISPTSYATSRCAARRPRRNGIASASRPFARSTRSTSSWWVRITGVMRGRWRRPGAMSPTRSTSRTTTPSFPFTITLRMTPLEGAAAPAGLSGQIQCARHVYGVWRRRQARAGSPGDAGRHARPVCLRSHWLDDLGHLLRPHAGLGFPDPRGEKSRWQDVGRQNGKSRLLHSLCRALGSHRPDHGQRLSRGGGELKDHGGYDTDASSSVHRSARTR